MHAPYKPPAAWARYTHTTWGELIEPIRSSWPTGTAPGEQEVIDGLLNAIDALHLKLGAADSPLRRVVPWIGRPKSTGKPLNACRRDHGMELRLSRYAAPKY
jgi:hypothetical protein